MSYDIDLKKDGITCESKKHRQEGGTYQIGGTKETSLNITYNYSFFYYNFLDKEKGIRWLYGKQGKDCVERLSDAVETLGTDRYKDYWAETPGNAGHALNILLEWAREFQEAIFDGD